MYIEITLHGTSGFPRACDHVFAHVSRDYNRSIIRAPHVDITHSMLLLLF